LTFFAVMSFIAFFMRYIRFVLQVFRIARPKSQFITSMHQTPGSQCGGKELAAVGDRRSLRLKKKHQDIDKKAHNELKTRAR
jgi:hypothetical protein